MDCFGNDKAKKLCCNLDERKYRIGNVSWFIENKGFVFQYTMTQNVGKKKKMVHMWKKLLENEDIDEPTSFLNHVYLGCSQRECKPHATIIDQDQKMFESRVSVGATEITRLGKASRGL